MIVTRKKQIPFHWVLLAVTPWGAMTFMYSAMGAAFLFSLKKFVENPVGLTFILTLPSYISLFLGPLCNFLSDRIWTRIGRRKPFIVVAWTGAMTGLILMPLMPNLWTLIGAYILFCVSLDIGSPIEALKQEIVPPQQRGRATAVMQWMQNGAGLIFAFMALGRFDDVRFLSGHLFTGEILIYWSTALFAFVVLFLLVFGIKEVDPKSPFVGQRISIKTFFKSILDRDLWPVYTLIFGAAMLNAGLGPLGNLLYTDQWNYTKQEMGTNIAIGGVMNLFIIGFLALIADRLNRMKAYQVLITLSLMVQAGYFCYVEFVLPDRRPSLIEIIFFGEALSILGVLTTMVYIPLVYDYVTRDKMGTYGAGASLLNRLTSIFTLNAIGFFIWGYALMFQPPAGDMTRICLKEEASTAQVRSIINQNHWFYPGGEGDASATQIDARPWYPTGEVRAKGICWEIRLHDKKSESLAVQRENLRGARTVLISQEKMLRDRMDGPGESPSLLDKIRREADLKADAIKKLDEELNTLDAALNQRASFFNGQVSKAFGNMIISDGEELLGAGLENALVLELAVTKRPSPALEKSLIDLRKRDARIIDLRTVKRENLYGLEVSARWSTNADEARLISELVREVTDLVSIREPGLFVDPFQIVKIERRPALMLHLKVVNNPINGQPSPITQLVNLLLNVVDASPQPEHRLAAMARSLRVEGGTEHVIVEADPKDARVITVLALESKLSVGLPKTGARTDRFQVLLGPGSSPQALAQAGNFYDRVIEAGLAQKIFIQKPLFVSTYASMKYDYMSGYICMLFLGLIGLAITFGFGRREKKGLIRKLGAEEAAAS